MIIITTTVIIIVTTTTTNNNIITITTIITITITIAITITITITIIMTTIITIIITVTIIIIIIVINITISFFTIIITTVNFYFLLSDILVFVFVVTFSLRRLICFWRYLFTIPRYRRNWRLILPEFLTFVECASLLCFTTAFSLWITRWNDLDGWQPSDKDYQLDDVFFSLASLLSFFRLAHYLKVREIIDSDLK